MLYNKTFLDELFLNRDREIYVRLDLLTWDEIKIKEIQGVVISGSLSVDGNSIIRRSINFQMILDPNVYFLPQVAEEINISRKMTVLIGLKNNTRFGKFPELLSSNQAFLSDPIIWFNLGSFVPTNISLSHDIQDSSISITGQDKMVLLNGEVSGELGYDIEFVNALTKQDLPYLDIIRDSVSYFGGIDQSKILISDIPYYAESLTRVQYDPTLLVYTTSSTNQLTVRTDSPLTNVYGNMTVGDKLVQIFTDETGEGLLSASTLITSFAGSGTIINLSKNVVSTGLISFVVSPLRNIYAQNISNLGKRTFNIVNASAYTTGSKLDPQIDPGNILGLQVTLSPKNQDTRIEVSSTNRVTDILDQVASDLLGQYEYFFDINGNFIFQSRKFLDELQKIDLFQNDNSKKYLTQFDSIPYIYDFNNKEIISSFSNSPNWRGIKNDFFVYGANNLLFHLAIDTVPKSPSTFYSKVGDSWTNILEPYNQPWQQYIIDLTEYNVQTGVDSTENRYYAELKKFFQFSSEENTGIYKKLSATTGVWRSGNTGQEIDDFNFSLRPNGDPFTWNYFFDIIDDSDASVGKFSINSIGRRVKSIRDNNITILYPRNLEPNYRDSFNREIKVILYEDLISNSIRLSTLEVTGGTNVTAVSIDPISVQAGDSIIISGVPSSIGTNLNGLWAINTASSDLQTFGFSTTGSSTNSKYYMNFVRELYSSAASGSTILTLFTGSQDIKTGLTVTGVGISASTTVTVVNTSANTVSITISKPLNLLSSARNTIGFSAGTSSVFRFTQFEADNSNALEIESELQNSEIPYVSILKSQIEPYLNNDEFQYKADAFLAMKNLIYLHTNFNESVSISSVPLYFLEPNNKINLTDINTGVSGDHFLQTFDIPLSPEGSMTLNAIKIQK